MPTEAELRSGAALVGAALLSGLGDTSETESAASKLARKAMLQGRNNKRKQNKTQKKKAAKGTMYSERKVVKVVKRDAKQTRRAKGKKD